MTGRTLATPQAEAAAVELAERSSGAGWPEPRRAAGAPDTGIRLVWFIVGRWIISDIDAAGGVTTRIVA